MGQEVLEKEALIGEIHAGDQAVMPAPDVEGHVIRPHPARRGEGVTNFRKGAKVGSANDGVPVFQHVDSVWIVQLAPAQCGGGDDIHLWGQSMC